MVTTADLLKIADTIADLSPQDATRLGRILVHEHSSTAADIKVGIDVGFLELAQELGIA